MQFRFNSSPDALQRVVSCLVYVIPLLDSLTFGRYIFRKVPALSDYVLSPLAPLLSVYRGVPFFAFGIFLALYILVVRNTNVPRFVRFNTQQALTIDIALIIPQLFASFGAEVPYAIKENLSTALFYAVLITCVYAWTANIQGKYPDQIPVISESSDASIGPF